MNTARTGLSRSPGYSGKSATFKPVKGVKLPGCLSETTQCRVLYGQFLWTYQGAMLAAGSYLREPVNRVNALNTVLVCLLQGLLGWFVLFYCSKNKNKNSRSQEAEAISGEAKMYHKTMVDQGSLGNWPH